MRMPSSGEIDIVALAHVMCMSYGSLMATANELSAIAWALSVSEASTFAEVAEAHETASFAHTEAARGADRATSDKHYSLARTHRIEAQTMRSVIAAGR